MALSRPVLAATLQASLLGALSNLLAQQITASRTKTPSSVDWIPVLQFLLFSIISTPPNFWWQDFLESTFPAHPRRRHHDGAQSPSGPGKHKDQDPAARQPPLSVTNTFCKFALDQTVGAVVNTLLFTIFIHSLRAAMPSAPSISNFFEAVAYWSSPGAIDFSRLDLSAVLEASLADFWPIILAGAKFWPAVSLVNFVFVKSVEARNLLGALAGVAWGVYMSMVAAQ